MPRRPSLAALALLPVLALALAGTLVRAAVAPAVARDTSGWITWDHPAQPALPGSALDMSFLLDAPAGKHGFVRVRGDGFVFEDGTEARFWGGNFFGEANFPEKEDADRLADIAARSGANLVRMHHLDVVAPWTDKVVKRSLFGGQQPETTRKLDPAMLDRFDYLVSCFKKRGIYVFLSHLSSRMVRPGDGFRGPAGEKKDWGFKVVGMFDPFLVELQKEYLRQLLTHVNPYTGLALVNDPVLAMTEVVNENTTLWTQEEGFFSIPSDHHRTMLRSLWNGWLRRRVGARHELLERWAAKDPGQVALAQGEDPMAGTVALPASYGEVERHHFSGARIRDTFLFLSEVQEAYFHTMSSHLLGLGLRCPLTGSNHWTDDLVDLKQNARLGYVDRHAYWTHPQGSYNYEQGQGIEPKPMVKDANGGLIGDFARRRVSGVPYTASEWHACLPNPYRAEGPPILAAYSALQGWHPLQYAYWGTSEQQPAMINSFEVMLDPTQTNLIPASALLFHRRDVREAQAGYWDTVPKAALEDPTVSVERHPAVALVGRYGLALPETVPAPSSDASLLAPVAGTRSPFRHGRAGVGCRPRAGDDRQPTHAGRCGLRGRRRAEDPRRDLRPGDLVRRGDGVLARRPADRRLEAAARLHLRRRALDGCDGVRERRQDPDHRPLAVPDAAGRGPARARGQGASGHGLSRGRERRPHREARHRAGRRGAGGAAPGREPLHALRDRPGVSGGKRAVRPGV